MYVVQALLLFNQLFYVVQTCSARPSFELYSSYTDGTHFILSVVFFGSSVEILKSQAYSSVVQHLLQWIQCITLPYLPREIVNREYLYCNVIVYPFLHCVKIGLLAQKEHAEIALRTQCKQLNTVLQADYVIMPFWFLGVRNV